MHVLLSPPMANAFSTRRIPTMSQDVDLLVMSQRPRPLGCRMTGKINSAIRPRNAVATAYIPRLPELAQSRAKRTVVPISDYTRVQMALGLTCPIPYVCKCGRRACPTSRWCRLTLLQQNTGHDPAPVVETHGVMGGEWRITAAPPLVAQNRS